MKKISFNQKKQPKLLWLDDIIILALVLFACAFGYSIYMGVK